MSIPALAHTWYTTAPYPNADDRTARFLAECLRAERGKDGPHKADTRRKYREAQDISGVYHPRANLFGHLNMAAHARKGEVGFRPKSYASARGHVTCARDCNKEG